MAAILNIETATKNCSVSISIDGKSLFTEEVYDDNYCHSEKLHLFISNLLKHIGDFSNLDAISISRGPGSYTGLRIGLAAAKGLCFSLEKPLISLSTLECMLYSVVDEKFSDADFLIPMIDARNTRVYNAVFNRKKTLVKRDYIEHINENSHSKYLLNEAKVCYLGNNLEGYRDILKHSNAKFLDGIVPSSRYMGFLAEKKFLEKDFENIAYFEPSYLNSP
ncbi:tRNA (adenosine(37)-N6)-threonylcarbamoyltransferase complex dimerization subunit type 1 TsaB [Ichthyobacterium seriolicida]|uniref:Peptidase M22 n=1 Tax=Ichthyobacterium seriolicida TaxID=242600 RepID=A0A1J1EAY2_9FLAO|nr:tRNA (adenosine(37)-N6)-threonylcarbamoyltransferase complex dimerization subunit type 1 TsaB [Ichthyobacterium seriolicida]BAV95099.1 peptidase M22 [Ichthyobacterium seriolicida]